MEEEQKYNEVVKAIQTACPDIMELKFGCRVKYDNRIRVIFANKKNGQWWLCLEDNYKEKFEKYLIQTNEGSLGMGDGEYADYENLIKILGRDIYIGDVLRAIDNESIGITKKGEFTDREKDEEDPGCGLIFHTIYTSIFWNLKLPLSKQKPEVWAFLHELLIT